MTVIDKPQLAATVIANPSYWSKYLKIFLEKIGFLEPTLFVGIDGSNQLQIAKIDTTRQLAVKDMFTEAAVDLVTTAVNTNKTAVDLVTAAVNTNKGAVDTVGAAIAAKFPLSLTNEVLQVSTASGATTVTVTFTNATIICTANAAAEGASASIYMKILDSNDAVMCYLATSNSNSLIFYPFGLLRDVNNYGAESHSIVVASGWKIQFYCATDVKTAYSGFECPA